MRRPSVLFINRVYPPYRAASGRVLRDLARHFAREGWQVTVITTGAKASNERDGAVRVIRLRGPEKPGNFIVYAWILLKLLIASLRLPKTHLLVTMTDPPFLAVIGRIVRFFKKNRHMHWCQDLYPDVFPAVGVYLPGFLDDLLKSLSRKAMKTADKVIVIGRCMARHLSHDGFDPKQITVIPNWPDEELAKPPDEEALTAPPMSPDGFRSHEEQHKHGPKFRVLYAGNIGRAHPVDTILKAAETLNETNHDVEFVFVGEGPRHDYINHERSKRRLDNIRLLPYQPASRLKELMESGDVHLVSMNQEVAGLIVPVKLYSALAVHRPCVLVGPKQSEVAKVIESFNAGAVVPQGDAKLLAEVIRQMRENSDKWFAAYEGAKAASDVFVPREAINAWIERAQSVVDQDLENEPNRKAA